MPLFKTIFFSISPKYAIIYSQSNDAKFFAHLDKESVLSYFRIEPTSAVEQIDCDEIAEWLTSCINRVLEKNYHISLKCPLKRILSIHSFGDNRADGLVYISS